ncbi:hypothetical protein ACFFIX_10035 [Metabacillus herbersteinensis]|uniref:Uncharacterized protein n=1 Tax=Metabacillus herbersteinensis TaxID=283816 RepID=A0ABV6GDM7_9BACI
MNIRSFLLKGIIVGAALVFPTDAFAEKSEQAQKQSTQNGHAMEVVKTVKDKDSTSKPPPQAELEVKLPNQASEKAQQIVQEVKPSSEKTSKAKQSTIVETKKAVKKVVPNINQEAETKKTKQQKTTPSNNATHTNDVKESSDKSIQHVISGENANQSTKKVQLVEDDKTEQSIKQSGSIIEEQETEEKKKRPSGQKKYPRDIVVVHSPHNTKIPNESSKDRTGNGQSTTSFVEKGLLEAEKYLNLKRIQPLVSRTYEFRNQWVNAPPFQPPQATPFF